MLDVATYSLSRMANHLIDRALRLSKMKSIIVSRIVASELVLDRRNLDSIFLGKIRPVVTARNIAFAFFVWRSNAHEHQFSLTYVRLPYDTLLRFSSKKLT